LSERYDIFTTDDVEKIKELMQQGWEYVMTYKEKVYLRKSKGPSSQR
jgi:hypothetical protein